MKRIEKIVEIILSQLMLAEDIKETEEKIILNLLKKGYALEEINEAFNFISKKLEESKEKEIRNKRFVRVLSPVEKRNLTIEAEGYLTYLYNFQIVDINKLEEIINHISNMDRLIDINELSDIIESFIGMKDFQSKHYEVYN